MSTKNLFGKWGERVECICEACCEATAERIFPCQRRLFPKRAAPRHVSNVTNSSPRGENHARVRDCCWQRESFAMPKFPVHTLRSRPSAHTWKTPVPVTLGCAAIINLCQAPGLSLYLQFSWPQWVSQIHIAKAVDQFEFAAWIAPQCHKTFAARRNCEPSCEANCEATAERINNVTKPAKDNR